MITIAEKLSSQVGVTVACGTLGLSRSSFYRAHQPQPASQPRSSPSRALSASERAEVRAVLNSARFQDDPPRQVYATLLD